MQKRNILPFNWRPDVRNIEINSIGDDVILLEKPYITSTFKHPFKIDVTAIIICIKGTTEGFINLTPYTTDGACFFVILPGQILEYKSISDDFRNDIRLAITQKFN
jgi:hypothetical protein